MTRFFTILGLVLVSAMGLVYWTDRPVTTAVDPSPAMAATASAAPTSSSAVERVMVIGGSVAHGWKAVHNDGYLQRAFQAMSDDTKTQYVYYDRTIVGADGSQLATLYKGRYSAWLAAIRPQVVVISWGLLNDAYTKVTQAAFRNHLLKETRQALAEHAIVLIVTPPVTKATYTEFRVQEPQYVQSEMDVVKRMDSPNVILFNVFDQMKAYLVNHHQTYVPYMGDGWHPNTAGHILAGTLLYQDLRARFGVHPIAPH